MHYLLNFENKIKKIGDRTIKKSMLFALNGYFEKFSK